MSTNIVKSDDDCFFFFNATCTKGDACPFRHSTVAYGSDVVCSFWREGKCIKGAACKYRHMEIRKSRNKIECFFEKQPGGCKKSHCPFLHSNKPQTRSIGDEDGEGLDDELVDTQSNFNDQLIQSKSISDQEIKGSGDGVASECLLGPDSLLNEKHPKPCLSPSFSPNSSTSTSKLLPTSPSSTIATIGSEPVSISIDIAEESENEPEDTGCSERKSIRLTPSGHNSEKNFGIKTLEQIRMEKVFRQNDVNRQQTDPEPTGTSGKQFRVKLKRKSVPVNNSNCNTSTSTSPGVLTTITTTAATDGAESKSVSPGLKIKSLDEIRREKEQPIQSKLRKESNDCEKDDDKPKKVIKIKRTHLDMNKPSEPPSKIVKINKLPIEDGKSVSTRPSIKCSQSPIQSTPSTLTPPISTSSNPLKAAPKERLRLHPNVPPKTPVNPPNPAITQSTTRTPVPVATKPTNVKSELKRLTISSRTPTSITVRPTVTQPNVSNEEKSMNSDNNQSLVNPNSFYSTDKPLDDQTIPYDDGEDEDKYNSDASSNLSFKTDDQQVNKMISSSSMPQLNPEESVPDDTIDDSLTVNLEEANSLLKTDDDLLEEDDLLADGESAPDDVAIEDEDDEFLKELEHVINS